MVEHSLTPVRIEPGRIRVKLPRYLVDFIRVYAVRLPNTPFRLLDARRYNYQGGARLIKHCNSIVVSPLASERVRQSESGRATKVTTK